MEKIRELLTKYRSVLLYIVFGGLTTLVNMAVYWLCFSAAGIPNVPSTVTAWLLAVIFAFITNKIWVFGSRSFDGKTLRHEIPTFFGARIATGLLDVGIMYLAVDVLQGTPAVWKLVSNVIVIVLNWIASRLVIFKEEGK